MRNEIFTIKQGNRNTSTTNIVSIQDLLENGGQEVIYQILRECP